MRYSTSRLAIFRSVVFLIVLSSVSFLALAQGPNRNGLYVPPENNFILDPSESRVALELGSLPLSEIQRQLDQARADNPDSPIVLTLTGIYQVSDTPLTLPSKTALVLYGTIEAAPDATASTLIAISGQSQVAVAGGLLEGNGSKLSGIEVQNSTKINLDAVTIRDTGLGGISLKGAGNDVWNSGSAITRCEVVNAGGNGITIGSITQALALDNFVHGNGGVGIQVSASHSSVVNNVSQDNDVGVLVDSNDS